MNRLRRPLIHFCGLALGGAVAGLLDGWLAVTWEGLEALDAETRWAGVGIAGSLGLLAGLVGGLLLVPAAIAAGEERPRLRGWASRPAGRAAVLGILSLCALSLGLTLGTRTIQWDAVDWRPPGLAALLALVYLTIVRFLQHWLGWVIASLAGLLLAGASLGTLALAEARGVGAAALTRVGTEAELGRRVLAVLRWASDGDDDGYPRALCSGDCDCDDGDPRTHPGGRDEPENGQDEDCSGADLTKARALGLRSLVGEAAVAVAPPPAPSQILAARAAGPPNLVLVIIDTLRADHLGSYGYRRRPTSPRIDRFAERAVVFDQARATGPSTRFSVPPVLIGRYFTEIGRDRGVWPIIAPDEILLAERLAAAGYHTAAFHTVRYFLPEYGMAQGFAYYDTSALEARHPVTARGTSDYLTDRVLAYADAGGLGPERPFFLLAYYGDPHSPYVPHPEVADFGEHDRDVYDAEVRFVDEHLGRLLEGLDTRGLTKEAIVVVTSDHGEALSPKQDHGHKHHSATLYDELVRVPLLVRGPGLEPRRVGTSVSLLDLPATFLDLAGLPRPPGMRGVSLGPWLEGRDPPHPPVFFEKHRTWDEPQKGMVHWPYKVIRGFGYEFLRIYDLAQDPREQVDLSRKLPREVTDELEEMLLYWQSEVLKPIPGNPRN
jgi:arylsulfatase A-like enzyme